MQYAIIIMGVIDMRMQKQGVRYQELKDEKCRLCGCSFGLKGKSLIIHHINGNHDDDGCENRLIICRLCHSWLHYHLSRGDWQRGAVFNLYISGYTMQSIGCIFGISRQRVHQILKNI